MYNTWIVNHFVTSHIKIKRDLSSTWRPNTKLTLINVVTMLTSLPIPPTRRQWNRKSGSVSQTIDELINDTQVKKSWILYLFIIYLCIHHIIFIHFHSNHPIIRLLPRKTSLNFLIDANVTLSDFYEICIMRSSIVSGLDPSGPCHPTFFIVRNLEEGRYVKHNSLWHSDAIYRHNYRPGDHFTKKRASFQSELAFSFTTVCRKLASFWKKLARFLMCFTKLLAFCDPENT